MTKSFSPVSRKEKSRYPSAHQTDPERGLRIYTNYENLTYMSIGIVARPLHAGMGEGVAARTVLRTNAEGKREEWWEVAERVAAGNTAMAPEMVGHTEQGDLEDYIAQGVILLSGRH